MRTKTTTPNMLSHAHWDAGTSHAFLKTTFDKAGSHVYDGSPHFFEISTWQYKALQTTAFRFQVHFHMPLGGT